MAVYTVDSYLKKINRDIKNILSDEKEIMFKVATAIHADKSERIFTRGLNANGRKWGEYSTNPLYVSNKNSPRNLGDKGRLFKGGYKAFKMAVGRGSKVNFRLFGDLQTDYSTSLRWKRGFLGGGRWVEGLKRANNNEKAAKLGRQYNQDNIFDFTTTERRKASKLFTQILNSRL